MEIIKSVIGHLTRFLHVLLGAFSWPIKLWHDEDGTIIIEIWFHCEPPLNINHKSHCPIDKRRRWLLYIFSLSVAEEVKLWHTVVLRWRREFHFPFNCYASLLLFLARGSGGGFLPLGPWVSIEIACCHLKEHWTNQGSGYLWPKMGWHLLTLYRQRPMIKRSP